MRTPCSCGLAVVLLLAVVLPAFAGDKEDLEARIKQYYQAWNEKKVDEYLSCFSSTGLILAGPNGGVFSEPLMLVRANIDTTFRNPKVQNNLTPRYIRVDIYGNGTIGVAHYYRLGSQTNADGATTQVTQRVTDVWVKEKTEWRAAHRHLSPWKIGQTTP